MRGSGTLYRQSASRFWWMQYFHRGRRFRRSTGCDRIKDAQDVLRKTLVDIEQQDHSTDTVAGLYAAIEHEYAINGRKSLPHLKSLWKNHLAAYFSLVVAAELAPDQIVEYIRRRRDAGAANASINRELAALKRMYKIALKAQRVKTVPYIALLEERNVRKGFVRDDQYEALARETGKVGLWLRTMFELAYTYGWRKSELLGLRVAQVDLAERTVELNPGETKNDQGRVVVMTAQAWQLLQQCIAGKHGNELVFTRADGSAVRNFRRIWTKVCGAAGVPDLLFHDLRRSGIRNMRRHGIPEKVAMTISGHRTRSVFERYNIIDQADLKEAVMRIEQGTQRCVMGH
jgi:integrase